MPCTEVAEEGCARVFSAQYLGCQLVDEFDGDDVVRSCYQVRYCARLQLQDWFPAYETFARRMVSPDEFLQTLAWGNTQTALLILDRGLAIERAQRARYARATRRTQLALAVITSGAQRDNARSHPVLLGARGVGAFGAPGAQIVGGSGAEDDEQAGEFH